MAISLSKAKIMGAKRTEGKRQAKEYAHQQARAQKRGFFSKVLGGVGGKLLGGAITGFLGLTGIGAPIGLALGNMLAKKGAHEMTKSMAADPSQIVSKSKYGFGTEEAKTLREGLEEQVRESDPFKQQGGFGKELLSSFVSAGASGELKGTLKGLTKPGTGTLFKTGEGAGLLGGGGIEGAWEGAKAGVGDVFGAATTWGGEEEDAIAGVGEEVVKKVAPTFEDLPGSILEEGADVNILDIYKQKPELAYGVSEELPGMEQGGLVPEYKNGGTISDYFGRQGVSLGGSFKHSFAEMLGRR